ncbi:hypothetical protein GOB57_08630 [Sinorhizobium meliloti]|nr:hypothetical protein [Sinorhizobium meliloti]
MSYAKLAGDNPFLLWVLLLNNANAVEVKSNPQTGAKDVILGVQGSRRFGVAILDGIPYLGYVDRDREAMEAVKWTTAALLFNKPDKDYVALSSVDARMDTTQAMNPVPLRLFIPVSSGRLAAWKENMPKELAIGPMTLNAKGEAVVSASPFRKLPLKVS